MGDTTMTNWNGNGHEAVRVIAYIAVAISGLIIGVMLMAISCRSCF
jgi:hypothetical protein